MDIIHYNMFGINKLKRENLRLKNENDFLKTKIGLMNLDFTEINKRLENVLLINNKLSDNLFKCKEELNLINASRRANADDYKEKYY